MRWPTYTRSVMWFRRDLRRNDHPAITAAAEGVDQVVPLFVVDPELWGPAGPNRRTYLVRSLRALDDSLKGALVLRTGDPVHQVVDVARSVGATRVHVSADFGPYGAARDVAVAHALAQHGIELVRTGSPYAVDPGGVRKADGTPYQVFTPFQRAWANHGWQPPHPSGATRVVWKRVVQGDVFPRTPLIDASLPAAGEAAAFARWERFRSSSLPEYEQGRDRPDLDATSRLSVHLKFGEIHPRTLLADLGDTAAHNRFRSELAWREFYADVLHHQPSSAREYLHPQFARMEYDAAEAAGERLAAWQTGRTGYPLVDAGMRQLLAEGWMHNRVRMVVASFLVKDLHLEWQLGAQWFMRQLVDGDLASNAHGWQWTAGCGTDAAPYVRVFNPVQQGLRFDPDGDYVRRYVPELRQLAGAAAHEPWSAPDGYTGGYPARIVDHAVERREALARFAAVQG